MEEIPRSDCRIACTIKDRGGIVVKIRSKVGSLYGDAIRGQAEEACKALGVRDAVIQVADQGALPFALAARLEATIKSARASITTEYLTGSSLKRVDRSVKDRLRRTRLYIPGNEPKFMPNAGLHRPDMVILDLEDSVAPSEKVAARFLVRNALRAVDFFDAERAVRINQGNMGLEDLRVVVPQLPDIILVPKCETADTVRRVADALGKIEKQHLLTGETLILPIIESALGVVNAHAIATASRRVCALAIGLEDYSADIGVERTAEGKESLYARETVITNAKAAGLQALDSVWSDVDDHEGLRKSALESKAIGFDGIGCIHPRQIAVVHEAFKPSAAEVERARRIIEASEAAKSKGLGVVALGSKMIDAPVVLRAERILRAAAMGVREDGAR